MSIDSTRPVAPLTSNSQVALTGPLFCGFSVSTTPKKTSVLPSLMMPCESDGKIVRLSSSTANGIVAETPRWYFWKPSPADPKAPFQGFVKLFKFRLVLPTMSNATT